MGFQRRHSFQDKSNPKAQPTTQFGSRPFPAAVQMKPKEQQTPEELENETFQRDKFEAQKLQLKEKNGTITPEEQERLGGVKVGMEDFWAQRMERTQRFGHHFANIQVTPPDEHDAPPIQPMWRHGTPGEPLGGQRSLLSSPQQSSPLPIQCQLAIGQPGDQYEQEADRVASQVVEQIHAPASAQSTQGQPVQRQEEDKEKDEELQAKPEISALQRMEQPKEEDIQAKSIQKREEAIAGREASTDLETTINSARGSGQPLEADLQQSMGQAMGADFSGVRVHTDSQSDQLNQSIQAKAFTTGQDVFFRQGEYNPGSRGGQELIAHELTHVLQQNGDAVRGSAPPKESVQRRSSAKIISRKRTIQRDTVFHKARRIIGRFLNKKKLPVNTYRWDTRTPDAIAVSGFQPWNPAGNIRLDEHVNNAFASGAKQGQAAKMESQWVSTGAYGMLQQLDPTFAQQVLNTNLYKINTATAKNTGGFTDANDYFDKMNRNRPYASQREWIKLGGIPPEAVVEWMTGKAFLDQYDFTNGAPDENALTGWQPMPTRD